MAKSLAGKPLANGLSGDSEGWSSERTRKTVPTRNFRSTSRLLRRHLHTRLNCRRAVLTNAAAWARKKGRAVLIVHVHVCLQAKDHLLSWQHYLLFWRQHSSTTVEALRQAQFH